MRQRTAVAGVLARLAPGGTDEDGGLADAAAESAPADVCGGWFDSFIGGSFLAIGAAPS